MKSAGLVFWVPSDLTEFLGLTARKVAFSSLWWPIDKYHGSQPLNRWHVSDIYYGVDAVTSYGLIVLRSRN